MIETLFYQCIDVSTFAVVWCMFVRLFSDLW